MAPTLSRLPGELLVAILSWGNSYSVLDLWKCGDSTLSYKLERFITHIDLMDSVKSSQWPQALSRFLSVDRSSFPLGATSMVRQSIQALPQTLEHLIIHGSNAEFALLRPEYRWSGEESDLVYTPSLAESEMEIGDKPAIWDIGSHFPSLKELNVTGRSADSLTSLGVHDLNYLPQSLTSLRWYLNVNASALFALPRGLQKCVVRNVGFDSTSEGLPPTLEILHYVSLEDSISRIFETEACRSGALFNLGMPGYYGFTELNLIGLGSKRSINWPPRILGLRYASWDQFKALSIPNHLVSLSISFGHLSTIHSNMLPNMLESLEIPDIQDWESITTAVWPPGLRRLHFTSAHHFQPLHFHLLPRTLKSLEATFKGGSLLFGDQKPTTLISRLQALGLASLAKNPKEEAFLEAFSTDAATRNWCSAENVKEIKTSGRHFGLPLSLERLSLTSPGPLIPINLILPPLIRSATLHPCMFSLDTFATEMPRLLENFTVGSAISEPIKPSLGQLASMSDYAPLLTSFDAGGLLIARNSFAILPRVLQRLKITLTNSNASTKVSDDMLADLPPALTSLDLELYPGKVDKRTWPGKLPRSLISVDMPSWGTTGKALALLPPGLTRLKLDSLLPFKRQDLKLLPESLTTMFFHCSDPNETYEADLLNPWVQPFSDLGDLTHYAEAAGNSQREAYQRMLEN